jgi:hypothetical protein
MRKVMGPIQESPPPITTAETRPMPVIPDTLRMIRHEDLVAKSEGYGCR